MNDLFEKINFYNMVITTFKFLLIVCIKLYFNSYLFIEIKYFIVL